MESEHTLPFTCFLLFPVMLTPALVAGGWSGCEWPLLAEGQPSLLCISLSLPLPNLSVSFPPLPPSSHLSSLLHCPLASLPTPFISLCPP